MMLFPMHVDPPLIIFALLPLSLFCFKIAKIIYLYRTTVNASVKHTFSAALAGLALSHTVAVAVLQGFMTKHKPFFRTPKLKNPSRILKAIVDVREECILATGLWGSAFGVYMVQSDGEMDLNFWILLLIVQSLPYIAAFIMAIISVTPLLPAPYDKNEEVSELK
jgi:hypothetical protein